jgi:hypothetical protein
MAASTTPNAFIDEWNDLDRAERLRLRRLVRMGRPVEEPALARLAPAYAQYQCNRPWMRYFWVWFVPAMLLALLAAAGIHPLLVGVVLALGAQAAWASHCLRRVARQSE